MIVFWTLLIWAVYTLVNGIIRRDREPERGERQPVVLARSWTSGWPAARSTPRSTAGCVSSSTAQPGEARPGLGEPVTAEQD